MPFASRNNIILALIKANLNQHSTYWSKLHKKMRPVWLLKLDEIIKWILVSQESKHAFDFFHHPKVAQQRGFQVPFGLLSCTSHHRQSPYSEYHALLQGRAAVDGFPFSCTKRRRGIGALAATAVATRARA